VDNITAQLDQLSELTDDQITELESTVVDQFESFEQEPPTPESVEAMTTLADMLDAVKGEAARREAQTAELSARAAEAASRVHGDPTDAPADADADQDVDSPEDPTKDDDEDAPVTAAVETEAATDEVEVAVETAPESAEEAAPEADAETEFAAADEALVETEEVVADAEPEAEVSTELATDETPAEELVEEVSTELASDEATDEVATDPETELAAEASADADAEVPAEAEASNIEETDEQTAQEEAPMTAAAEESFQAPADRQPVAQVTEAPVAITAGADIPGYSAGSALNNMDEVAQAFVERLRTVKRANGGDGEQHVVASLVTNFPESRILTSDAESNWDKIQNVVGPEALTASGGHATPLEVVYTVYGLGSDARPVRDSLPRFQADRGGIRFITPPVLASYTNAVGVWTNTVDTTPGGATKATLSVTGAAEQTAVTDAVTLQLQFGNFFARAYPELVARHNELALIMHARQAELNLLAKIAAASTAVTTTSLIGFGRDFLVQIRRAATAYRSRQRIDPNTGLTAIIPTWVYDAIASDLALAMPGDGTLGISRAEIDGFLGTANVSLVASLDQNSYGAQSGSGAALLEFPDSFTWYLFAEGTFLFLDGGTLDIGIIRDSTLVSTNDYKMFMETFEGLAFVGVESLAITSTISVNGAAAALRDTTGGATAAAIEY
jgi:chemotaxis protein histidine kinase CheA